MSMLGFTPFTALISKSLYMRIGMIRSVGYQPETVAVSIASGFRRKEDFIFQGVEGDWRTWTSNALAALLQYGHNMVVAVNFERR